MKPMEANFRAFTQGVNLFRSRIETNLRSGIVRLAYLTHLTKIWLMFSSRAAQAQLLTHWGSFLFLIGKVVRFLLFFVY